MLKSRPFPLELTSTHLHLLAMFFMLLDHMWATIVPGQSWMTSVGRLAFPIYAFLAVEGYFHTHSFRRYMTRLFILAVISEVPFNLMYSGEVLYPFHQNVIWTLMLGLFGIWIMERVREKHIIWVTFLTFAAVWLLGWLLGTISMVDYYGAGVLTIFVFYQFRENQWWYRLGQVILLYWINVHLIGGLFFQISLGGISLDISQQGLALLALLPIWLYHGRQGRRGKAFQYACYGFYPLHMLLLFLLSYCL